MRSAVGLALARFALGPFLGRQRGGCTALTEPSRLRICCSRALHSAIGRSDVSRRPLSSMQV
jgi:hypothetical protein